MEQRSSWCLFCRPAAQPGSPDFWFIFQPYWPTAATWTTENMLAWCSQEGGCLELWVMEGKHKARSLSCDHYRCWLRGGTLQVLSMPPHSAVFPWHWQGSSHAGEQGFHLSISLFVQRPQLLGQQDHLDHQKKTTCLTTCLQELVFRNRKKENRTNGDIKRPNKIKLIMLN